MSSVMRAISARIRGWCRRTAWSHQLLGDGH
jgi:hypothetical protein